MRKALISAIAVVMALTGVARADSKTVRDGNDTPGRLDLNLVNVGHICSISGGTGGTSCDTLTYTLGTFRHFGARALVGSRSSMRVPFDTDADGRPERFLLIDVRHGRFYGVIKKADGTKVDDARVKHDRRAVVVDFPEKDLGHHVKVYRWKVATYYAHPHSERCWFNGTDTVHTCTDHVPDKGWVRHDLRKS